MTSFKEIVASRRSHRIFTQEKVKADQLQLILRAALLSPTSRNRRSWHFYVIDDAMQLQCEDLGLGSCWIQMRTHALSDGTPSSEVVRGIANVADDEQVLCVLAIGVPAKQLPPHKDEELLWENVTVV